MFVVKASLLFGVFSLFCVPGGAQETPQDEDVAIIHNLDPMFLKIGEKRVVFCKGRAKEKNWLDPRGEQVRERSHELRVHVERRAGQVVLVFADPKPEDNGTWTCASPDQAKTIDIYIVEEVSFEGMKKEESPIEGSRLELTCRARGIPNPNLMWYRDGAPISEVANNRFKELDGKLRIEHIQRGDSGEYECKSIQKVGSIYLHVNSAKTLVQVQHPPLMEHDSVVDVFAIMNETKVLRCVATAYPKPSYKWTCTDDRSWNEEIQKSVVTAEDGAYSELTLDIRTPQDLMSYTCTVSNSRGKNKTRFHVQMGNKPQPLDGVEFVSATNESMVFAVSCANCTTIADPAYSPSAEDLPVTHYRFELINTTEADVDWKEVADQIIAVDLERNFTQTMYTVGGLQPMTTYQIRAASVNLAGYSDFVSVPAQTTLSAGLALLSASTLVVMSALINYFIFVIIY